MEYAHLALHLLPTLAVVVLATIIARAVTVRVTWRRSSIRRLDDSTAPTPMRDARRVDASPQAGDAGPAEHPATSPLRPHAA